VSETESWAADYAGVDEFGELDAHTDVGSGSDVDPSPQLVYPLCRRALETANS
jgi:hypothetical protein